MPAASKNVIEETWLAYAFDRAAAPGRVEAGLERVASHYGRLVDGPLVGHAQTGARHGVALWVPEHSGSTWPLWAAQGPLCIAASSVPTGWQRVVGAVASADAPGRLARA